MPNTSPTPHTKRIAIVGAGLAGVACARTLQQAGHSVSVFEKSRGAGGRMSTRETPFGGFDHGAQYFTVRDARFAAALNHRDATPSGLCRPWSANAVRVLDPLGRVVSAPPAARELHWVAQPGMNALVRHWAQPLALHLQAQVTQLERDALNPQRWQLRIHGAGGAAQVHAGFDVVLLAIPSTQALALLRQSLLMPRWCEQVAQVQVAPCWTLMIAFPQAMQPGMSALGPHWNAARSTHHRVAWVAREPSKPGRASVERWTVQASADWSREHLEDDAERVAGKLLKAFAEITGIRAQPSHVDTHRWRYAKTEKPLGQSYLWDNAQGIGLCGDWCIGHRVEDAFVSGLELALAAA